MKRSVLFAYILAAVFAVVVLVALVARPLHYERTLALGAVLMVAAVGFGYVRSRQP